MIDNAPSEAAREINRLRKTCEAGINQSAELQKYFQKIGDFKTAKFFSEEKKFSEKIRSECNKELWDLNYTAEDFKGFD